MSRIGLLHKLVFQNPEGICCRRTKTNTMLAIRQLSCASSVVRSVAKSSSLVPKSMSLVLKNQFPCTTCSQLKLEIPHRSMSLLDRFRRKKLTQEELNQVVVDPDDEALPSQIFSLESEDEKAPLSEEEIEAKRNKSRLRDSHRRLVHGEVPYSEPVFWTHHTVKHKQKMYARYGEKSGVNPGIMWPTQKDLQDKIEYEKICNPFTIQEMVRAKQELRAAQKVEFERREKEVDERMKLVDKFKAELFAKQDAKENELEAAKERREKLMEEVRRHFGYTVDPKDDRFKELLEKKEKEQRKKMKEARKLEKQQRILDKLDDKKPPKPREVKPKVDDDGY